MHQNRTAIGIDSVTKVIHLVVMEEIVQLRRMGFRFIALADDNFYPVTVTDLRLAEQHSNLHYLPTLSRSSPDWQGLRGYVQQHVPEIAEGRSDMHAYICGLDKMVKANRELLKSLGWDRTSIRYEKYD